MEINVRPKKDSKVWLVISDVCMTDCVHLQCKLTQGTMCFKILTSQSDSLNMHGYVLYQSHLFIFFWQILPFLFSFIKHSSALSKMRCWQYCITNAPLSPSVSLSFSCSLEAGTVAGNTAMHISSSLSLSHARITGFPYPSLSVSALIFLLPLFSPWAQVL